MFLDTSFNSLATVLGNIYENFTETATKMWMYAKCLPSQKQPGAKLVISESLASRWNHDARAALTKGNLGTIENLVDMAFVLLKSKGKNKKNEGYRCAVSKAQVEW